MTRRLVSTLFLPVIALVAALGFAADARPAKPPPPAAPAGKPVSCVPTFMIDRTEVRDDRTIDFYMRGPTNYRVTLPAACPTLGREQRFSYVTSINQLCSTDIITVLRTPPSIPGPSCGLAPFQPVTGLPR